MQYDSAIPSNNDTNRQATGRKGNNMYYAIEVIGYGKRTRYTIKQVLSGGGTNPTNGKWYRTEAAARSAAAEMGIEIYKVGDLYEII